MSSDGRDLAGFIDAVKAQGASDEFVVALLKQNGWAEKKIYQALGAWYETRTGRAVPEGGGRIESARDAFLYLLAFLTLGIWTTQLGALVFGAIDRAFPNVVTDRTYGAPADAGIANAVAGILVAFPLYLLVSRAIARGLEKHPEGLESPVRRWLTYIALVIAAGTMIGDLVTFLAFLLRGDLDARFVLKAATVLAIAGGVFSYYLDSMRGRLEARGRDRAFALAAAAAVVLALAAGFTRIGSPETQRVEARDARRLYDLSTIAIAIEGDWMRNGVEGHNTPASLEQVERMGLGEGRIHDPATGQLYTYQPLGGPAYRLCANFAQPSRQNVPPGWRHGAGVACFTLDARQRTASLVPPE